MKEDYLWDKTGADAEIEKLETALRVFRYEETAAPAIPAKVLPFVKKEVPRRDLAFLRAIAACLAFALISSGMWLLIPNSADEIIQIESQNADTKKENIIPVDSTFEPKDKIEKDSKSFDEPKIKQTKFPEWKLKPKALKIRNSASSISEQTVIEARRNKNIKQPVRLTKEEKYAYDQLMLALSITSSKLKLVKEKIDGAENQTSNFTPNNTNSRRK